VKILYVVVNLKIGGIQRVATLVAKEHVRQGHEVHLLCLEDGKELDVDPGIQVHVLKKSSLFKRNPLWALWWILYKILLRNLLPQSEAIWAAPLYSQLYGAKLRELEINGKFGAVFVRGIRCIKRLRTVEHPGSLYSLHRTVDWLNKPRGAVNISYYRWLHRWVFNGKNMMFVSRELQDDFMAQAKTAGTQIDSHCVINNPCDVVMIRERLKEPHEFSGPFILSVDRLTRQKRHDVLLRAFAKVETDRKLVLLGSGNQEKSLKELARELGIADKVRFEGMDPNPYRWMAKAEMFVLSSDFEGFPNVLLEALVCSTPIIATRCQGAADILAGEMAQGLVDIGDADGMAKAISCYLEAPVKPAEEEAARFSIDACANQYLEAATGG
jgi:glycosyltransferase involved in cell wall biosynthesis